MYRVFCCSFALIFILSATPSTVFVLYYNSASGLHIEGNRKLQWVFVFGTDCPKQWIIFLFGLGDWKGTHVTERRLALCLISHFLYSSREFWHWRMFPPHSGPLWKWLHNSPTRKLKKRKKRALNSYCLLPLTKPWGISLLRCSISSRLCG